ncbi:MAG: trypsin-like peptidase domain-containing protein [Gammaproteobacteria bacterium]|nr:trypsin-like peptidase domain-containing protein [Gammaproteobacteria bacterium]
MKLTLLVIGLLFSATIKAADFAQLYETHSDSVVTVYTASVQMEGGKANTSRGVGSGVLIENNQVLTAAHVVDNANIIEVQFKNGERVRANVVSSLQASDVALIKLVKSPSDPIIAKLGDSDKTPIGSEVFIIGSPFGISQTLSVGHLSGRMNRGLMAAGTPIEFLQTDTAINTGNSGGPMFNTDGEVIGIVSFILSKSGGFDGIGFATSINTAKEALLGSSGVLAGFEGVILNERIAKALNLPQTGLLVQRVLADSVAGRAGLQAGYIPAQIAGESMLLGGDLILEINGLVCSTPHDFELVREASLKLNENESYAITVFRDNEIVELIAGLPAGTLNIIGTNDN